MDRSAAMTDRSQTESQNPRSTGAGRGLRLPGAAVHPRRCRGAPHRHACRRRCSWPATRPQGQARGALSVPRFLDAGQAQSRLRRRDRGEPAVCAELYRGVIAITREPGGAPRARRRRRTRRVGGRDAALRRDEDARPARRAKAPSISTLADRLGRAIAAAHRARAGGRRRAVDRSARRSTSNRTMRRFVTTRRCSRSLRSHGSPRQAAPRSRGCARCWRRAPTRTRAPRARRPPSRQYRADRRAAGAVRCARVRSGRGVG